MNRSALKKREGFYLPFQLLAALSMVIREYKFPGYMKKKKAGNVKTERKEIIDPNFFKSA